MVKLERESVSKKKDFNGVHNNIERQIGDGDYIFENRKDFKIKSYSIRTYC